MTLPFTIKSWYFTVKDVEWYLANALFVASAWHRRRAVGLAALCGDGRIAIELDTLIVDGKYRGNGVGTALLEMRGSGGSTETALLQGRGVRAANGTDLQTFWIPAQPGHVASRASRLGR